MKEFESVDDKAGADHNARLKEEALLRRSVADLDIATVEPQDMFQYRAESRSETNHVRAVCMGRAKLGSSGNLSD